MLQKIGMIKLTLWIKIERMDGCVENSYNEIYWKLNEFCEI